MSRIAFLGAGNMVAAMVEGLLAQKAAPPADLACYTASGRTAARLAERTGIRQARSLAELLQGADVLVIGFKPQHLAGADPSLANLSAGRLVVSLLAGKTLATLAKGLPQARNIVRCMPNTPAQIGAGITGWCSAQPLSAADQRIVDTALGALGLAVPVAETSINALTAVSGSGPAYVFEFAASLRDAGIAAGLDAATAEKLALETVLGAAKLLVRRTATPEALRDAVTSPNGVTFAALQKLAAGNFRGLIQDAVLAGRARADELARDA